MVENVGLCFRCDHRAVFLETGHGPRNECKDIKISTSGCYMFKPVVPLLLKKGDPKDKRPQFAGIISSRSHSGGLSSCRLNLEESKEGSTLYWTPKSLDELHIKARDMLWFLDCHPALGSPYFDLMSLLHIDISSVCKRGFLKPIREKQSLRYTPEKWAPDHIEYWGDLTFVVYTGKDFKKEHDLTKWQRLSGIEASGRSFEELIVNLGIKFKKIFGNFNKDKVLTPHERANNKGKMPFIFEKIKGNERCSTMLTNKDYIRVGPAEENRRWLKWFAKTTYCKKKWAETIKKVLAGEEKIF